MFHGRSNPVRQRADAPAGGGSASPDAAGAEETPLSDGQLLALQHAALENTANAVVITDLLGTIQWTNPAFTALTGYSAAEAYGRTPAILKSGEHDRPFYDELWRTVTAGRTWRGEFTNRRKDGTLYRGEQVITPVRSTAAGITHFVAVMNDVTARRAAEAAQVAMHRQLQHVLDHSPAVIYSAKIEGEVITPHTMGENIERLLGFTVAEALSFDWWLGQLHPDDRDGAVASIGDTLEQDATLAEYRLRHRDGSYRWMQDHCRLVRDAAGRPAEFIGILTDITERKRAEEVLRAAAARQSGRQQRRIQLEVAALALGGVLVFALGHNFGWFERLFALASNEIRHPFGDEVIGTLVILFPCLAFFSYRRSRESRAEASSQQTATTALRTLHAELEARIQQRTGELARANAGLRAEVAERRRTEDALRLFRALVDQSSDTIEVIDPATGRFLDVNDRGPQQLGCTREEYLHLRVCDIDPTIDPATWPQFAEQLQAAGFRSGEGRHRRKDKTTFPVEFDCRWVQIDRPYIVTVVRDISARREAQEALQQSEARYRALVDSAPTGIFVNVDNQFAYVNQAMCRILGANSPAEVIARPMFDCLHPDSHASIRERIARGQSGQSVPLMDQRYLRMDGSVVDVETTATPITFEGRPALQVIVNDITRRKQAEAALRESEALYQSLVEQMPAGVFRKDTEGRYVYVNAWFARLAGMSPAEHLGRTPTEIARHVVARVPRHPGAVEDATFFDLGTVHHAEIMRTSRRLELEHRWVFPDGRAEYLQVIKGPVFDSAGHLAGSQGVLFDITARKEAEKQLHEQREQWRALVATSANAVFVVQREMLVMVNPAATTMFGATENELLGRPVFDFVLPENHALIRRRIQQTAEQATPLPLLKQRLVRPDGRVTDVEASSVRFHFRGQPAVLVEARDITERLEAESARQEADARFRQLTDNIEQVFWLTDPAKNEILYVSPAYEKIWGRSCASLLASPRAWLESILPEDRDRVLLALPRQATGAYDEEYRIVRPDGSVRWIRDRAFPVQAESGAVYRVAGFAEDVTERNEAAAALREAKEQYQSIFQNSLEGIYQTTPEGRFRVANPAMARIFGYSSADALIGDRGGIGHQDYVDPQRREEFHRLIALHGMVNGFECEVFRHDGSRVWVAVNAHVVRDAQGTVVCYEGGMGDITERKRAESRLKLQHAVTQVLAEGGSFERTTQQILATIGEGLHWALGEFWTVDRTTGVLRCRDVWHPPSSGFGSFAAASRQFSCAPGVDLAGRVWSLGRGEWIADIAQVADCGRCALAGSLGLRSWIGFPVKLRNEILGVVGFFSAHPHEPDDRVVGMLDALGSQFGQFIERQQLAEQFRQAQKMEAVGTLAGGIAHDFNNIIAAISGYTELAKMELGENTLVTEHLDAVQIASTRAASLVRQILAFSRQQEHERRPVQLRHIVAEAMNLLRATIPTTIEFDFTFDRELPAVLADTTQIHQVVMNLATNAWHAMKDRVGRLGVALEVCPVDPHLAEVHPGLHPGTYVRLSVSDTGRGMDAATLSRIFEPFFTTKAPGEGTGLGLAVVHGIMQTHEGVVTVYSQPGEGTMFRLYFPASAGESTVTKVEGTQIPQGHGERVMYVDDEEPLAKMGRKVLERLGYTVDAHTSSVEALEAVRAHPTRYDLVITDLAMPVLTGTELAQQLLAIRPDLPVILITGYSAILTPARVQAMGIRELLSKPIAVDAMGAAIARVLAGAKTNLP